jgi:hypothetical protein
MERDAQQSHLNFINHFAADVEEWLRQYRPVLDDLDCASLFHNEQAAASITRLFKIERSTQTGGHKLKADGNRRRSRSRALNAPTTDNQKTNCRPDNPVGTIYASFSHNNDLLLYC